MCLLVLYFSPDHLRDPSNFAAVANKLLCSPVTQVLVFTKVLAFPLLGHWRGMSCRAVVYMLWCIGAWKSMSVKRPQ